MLIVGDYRTDGTRAGTVQIFDNSKAYNSHDNKIIINGKLYISTNSWLRTGGAAAVIYELDSPLSTPREIWYSSKSRLPSLRPFNFGPTLLLKDGTIYFFYQDSNIADGAWYKINADDTVVNLGATWPGPGPAPSRQPVTPLASDSLIVGNTRYFAFDDGTNGNELWMDDGSGSQLMEDLYPGANSSSPSQLMEVNGQLVFAATTPATGRELFSIALPVLTPTPRSNPPSVTTALIGGTLHIGGTSGDDQITIFLRATNPKMLEVNVNGMISAFRTKDVNSIIADGGDGNDTIKFDETFGKIAITSKIYGEAGNDIITGGSGADRIMGGDGNDWISGGAGNDIIYGEAGDDRLFGGDGKDYIVGGLGTDVIRGEADVDRILASTLLDDTRGNRGDQILNDA